MKAAAWILGTALTLGAAFGSSSLHAEDAVVAAALAKSAMKLNEAGQTEKARGLCYKSLANDENCADAIFELGKILEQDGNTVVAGDFYVRALRVMGKDEATYRAKITEAKNRLAKLNPYANQLSSAMGDYASDLGAAVKKNNDSLTKDETYELNQNIKLDRFVSADKLPKFERGEVTQPPPAKTTTAEDQPRRRRFPGEEAPPPPVNDIPLEVEKALKAPSAGWTKITGVWKKKAENVYEVTNGEAEKINGAIQCILHSSKGTLNMFVRNTKSRYEDEGFSSNYYASGYGYRATSGKASLYTPSSGFAVNDFSPYMERDIPFPAGSPKNHLMLTVDGNKIEYTINGKKEKTANYTIPAEGNFVIIISGTVTLEMPQTVGK
jgi:tetratricopeptide (TPR) repeat protein